LAVEAEYGSQYYEECETVNWGGGCCWEKQPKQSERGLIKIHVLNT